MACLPEQQPIECPMQFARAQRRPHHQDFYFAVPSQAVPVPAFHVGEEIPVCLVGVLLLTWRNHRGTGSQRTLHVQREGEERCEDVRGCGEENTGGDEHEVGGINRYGAAPEGALQNEQGRMVREIGRAHV